MDLPDEIMLIVFGYLAPRDLASAARVCANWSRVISDDALWRRPCVDAGWQPFSPAPVCGWRTALRRLAVGSVLVLYTGVWPVGHALGHVASVVVRARRSISQTVAAALAAIGRRGPIRLTSFCTPDHDRGSAADVIARWKAFDPHTGTTPLAALDAVAWDSPARGILRLSDSPRVRIQRLRASTWVVSCVADAPDQRTGSVASARFMHNVQHAQERSGAWADIGTGTLLWQGQAYEGTWKCGRRHGTGTQTFADGGRYSGQWHNGACQGVGRYDDARGGGYQGRWRRDCPHGRGRRWWPDGNVHDGAFADGQPHGPGTLIARNGMRAMGTWRDGKAHAVQWVSPFGPLWSPPFGIVL